MTPIISVIIGTYNPSISGINDAINSIVKQSFKDWELILYDDGSSFDVSEKINNLIHLDERITVLRGKENMGLACSLNNCLNISRGKYIARMDDDDISNPERFEIQKKFLDRNKEFGWVGSQATLFDKNGEWGIAARIEKPTERDFLHSSPFIHPSVMFRKEVLTAVNGYSEDKAAKRCEDYDLFMRLYSKGFKGYNLQIPLIKYNEDRNFLKRSWKNSVNESIIRWVGFKKMDMLSLRTLPYVIKPILVRVAAFTPRLSQYIRTNYRNGNVRDKRLYK